MDYALSIKQPWAALLVHGRKTIEIRRWSTWRRGRVLIHTGRVSDDRPMAWAHVTPEIAATAKFRGGVIGEAKLVRCNTYLSRASFARDRAAHLNESGWFQEPAMYGFVFAQARPLPFRRCAGSLYFFELPGMAPPLSETTSRLLVSVRSVEEAKAALAGGADLIDVKEPQNGSLGQAAAEVLAGVVGCVAGKRPVSAALGELGELAQPGIVPGLAFVKCGLANLGGHKHWRRRLQALRERVAKMPQAPEVVTVAYADWKLARAPSWQDVAQHALGQRGGTLLVDTFDKKWRLMGEEHRPATLLDWLSLDEVHRLCRDCRSGGVQIALAGSLRLKQVMQLLDARPTWFAVRGAVCAANDRDGGVHMLKVCSLKELLRWKQQGTIAGS
jgi:uncharacterized protein (UPF0264 family)